MVPPTTRPASPANRQPAPPNAAPRPGLAFAHALAALGPIAAPKPVAPKALLFAKLGDAKGDAKGVVHHARKRDDDGETDHGHPRGDHADALDPETRRFAQMAPPSTFAASRPLQPDAEIAPRARVSMEELLPALVKRIAWAGDKRRGSVQMELGAGPHAGTTVTVHADDGRVRVELHGDDSGALRAQLEGRGFVVE